MTQEEAKALIKKYNQGACTDRELELLESWFDQLNGTSPKISQDQLDKINKAIEPQLPARKSASHTPKLWVVVASAAAAILIAFSTWIYNPLLRSSVYTTDVQDITPGGNKAIITLANGARIHLDEHKSEIIIAAQQLRYADGSAIKTTGSHTEGINTITTPRGGQYTLTLADGSRVTLNAASSLKFPASFSGQSVRMVQLSGEAFFEITKDPKHPFIVQSKGQETKVLGTTFNISSYPSLPAVTTLLEGSVRLTNINGTSKTTTGSNTILKPGEQAEQKENKFLISQVDTDLPIAWKNGKTEFENAELKTIMQMLERWYDIETVYQSYPESSRFSGSVSRNKNISEILRLLESTGEVQFKIEGRRVIVTK